MRLISFEPFRTLGLPGVTYLKPEDMFRRRAEIAAADWVLFPEEWQLNPLLYALQVRVFPSVPSYRFGQDKVQLTRALWAFCPEHVPETRILAATPEAANDVLEIFALPFVVKDPRSAQGRGVHLIEGRRALFSLLPRLPVLYAQEYLEIARDLRVVWVGDQVVCAYWRWGRDGFHHNLAQGGEADFRDVPQAPLALVARVARHFGVDHGGFDLAEVCGHWYFLELNLRFGTAGLSQLGLALGPLILNYLIAQTGPNDHPGAPPLRAAV